MNDHNLEAAANPFAAAMPGADPAGYRLADGSEAVDAGALVANGADFAGLPRPAGAGFDVGAWELGAIDDSEPLVVTLELPPQPVADGAGFLLSATTSGGGGAPTFAWDCDGDGIHESDTGPAATVDCPGLSAGAYEVGVRATDASGSDDAAATLVVGDGAVCGNSIREPGEVCDGADLGGETCTSQGFTGGALSCVQCIFDTVDCTGENSDTLESGDLPTTGGDGSTGANEVGGGTGESSGGTAVTAGTGPDADDGGGDEGCGCRSPSRAPALASLLLLLAIRRRRPR